MPPYAQAGAQHSRSPANARIRNGDATSMRLIDLKRESIWAWFTMTDHVVFESDAIRVVLLEPRLLAGIAQRDEQAPVRKLYRIVKLVPPTPAGHE